MATSDGTHRRIAALLGVAADSADSAIDPSPTPESLGALYAESYSWPETSTRATVYVFEDYWGADAADAILRARGDRDGATTALSINGPLLFWGTAHAGDDPGAEKLQDLSSRFAGEE